MTDTQINLSHPDEGIRRQAEKSRGKLYLDIPRRQQPLKRTWNLRKYSRVWLKTLVKAIAQHTAEVRANQALAPPRAGVKMVARLQIHAVCPVQQNHAKTHLVGRLTRFYRLVNKTKGMVQGVVTRTSEQEPIKDFVLRNIFNKGECRQAAPRGYTL